MISEEVPVVGRAAMSISIQGLQTERGKGHRLEWCLRLEFWQSGRSLYTDLILPGVNCT